MQTSIERSPNDLNSPAQPLRHSYFMLVKTTTTWLRLAPTDRFAYLETVIKPLLQLHANLSMRFFDSEAFSGRVTDILLWETDDVRSYQHLIERLRETLFWGTYFEVAEILPAIENAYADYYRVQPL